MNNAPDSVSGRGLITADEIAKMSLDEIAKTKADFELLLLGQSHDKNQLEIDNLRKPWFKQLQSILAMSALAISMVGTGVSCNSAKNETVLAKAEKTKAENETNEAKKTKADLEIAIKESSSVLVATKASTNASKKEYGQILVKLTAARDEIAKTDNRKAQDFTNAILAPFQNIINTNAEASSQLEDASQKLNQVSKDIKTNSSAVRASHIFIHIAVEGQRPKAEVLKTKLESAGFRVEGIQNMGKLTGAYLDYPTTEIRYGYAKNDEDAKLADNIVGEVIKDKHSLQRRPVRKFEMRPNEIEIWFSKKAE